MDRSRTMKRVESPMAGKQSNGYQLFPGVADDHGHSPVIGRWYFHEDEHDHDLDHHHVKKSVLAKVKEKALKWKSLLAKKKHGHDRSNETPPWGASLGDEDEEEDSEYYGAPMYESQIAPDSYKESSSRQVQKIPASLSEANSVIARETGSPCSSKQSSPISTTSPNQRKTILLQQGGQSSSKTTTLTSIIEESPLHHASSLAMASISPNKQLAMKHADAQSRYATGPTMASNSANKELMMKDVGASIRDASSPTKTSYSLNKELAMKHADVPSLHAISPTKVPNSLNKEPVVKHADAPLGHASSPTEFPNSLNKEMPMKDANACIGHACSPTKASSSTLNKELAMKDADAPLCHANSPTTVSTDPDKELALKHADELALHYLDEFEASTPRHSKNIDAHLTKKDNNEAEAKENCESHYPPKKILLEKEDFAEKRNSNNNTNTTTTNSNYKSITEAVTEMLAPAYNMVSEVTHAFASNTQLPTRDYEMDSKMTSDKGVSVKEYIMQKLEPGEDEKALSRAITEAISPRSKAKRDDGDRSMVEKVRDAVSLVLTKEENKGTSAAKIVANTHAVEIEEEQEQGGRKLQAYTN